MILCRIQIGLSDEALTSKTLLRHIHIIFIHLELVPLLSQIFDRVQPSRKQLAQRWQPFPLAHIRRCRAQTDISIRLLPALIGRRRYSRSTLIHPSLHIPWLLQTPMLSNRRL